MLNLTIEEMRQTAQALETLWKHNNKRILDYKNSDLPRKQQQAELVAEQNKDVENARRKITQAFVNEVEKLKKENHG